MIKKMTKPQQQRYLSYQLDIRQDKDSYYSDTDRRLFRQYDKRLEALKTENKWEFDNTMRDYFAGNYIADINTFAVYLLLNYTQTQVTLSEVIKRMNVSEYHKNRLQSFCLGLQAKYQYQIITATFTHDLETINILI